MKVDKKNTIFPYLWSPKKNNITQFMCNNFEILFRFSFWLILEFFTHDDVVCHCYHWRTIKIDMFYRYYLWLGRNTNFSYNLITTDIICLSHSNNRNGNWSMFLASFFINYRSHIVSALLIHVCHFHYSKILIWNKFRY